MQYLDFLYSKLAEEAGELAQAGIKCQLFGEDGKDPTAVDAVTNRQALNNELTDLTAVLSLLNEHLDPESSSYYDIDEERLNSKRIKLKTMHRQICQSRMKGE